MTGDIRIDLDETAQTAQPASPLAEVAEVMAALIDSHPEMEAYAQGTLVVARSLGQTPADSVTVRMTVVGVSADADGVLE